MMEYKDMIRDKQQIHIQLVFDGRITKSITVVQLKQLLTAAGLLTTPVQ